MFNNSTIPMLEQVINFTQVRHGVLAGNLANMDTPGFRTADVSPEKFQSHLKEAIESRDSRDARYAKMTSSFSDVDEQDAFGEVREDMKNILFHDQSDVSLEKQVTEMAKNQMQHNLALTIMTQQFRLLQTAVSERVA